MSAVSSNGVLQAFREFATYDNRRNGDTATISDPASPGGVEVAKDVESASWHNRTWHADRSDVRRSINRNNTTRQEFLDALIDQYGVGSNVEKKAQGFSCLPAYIRKALKGTWSFTQSGDFGLTDDPSAKYGIRVTSGKPLSARRIRKVFQAIDEAARRQEQANSATGVAKVGGTGDSQDFESKFSDFFKTYDFGIPLVGKSAAGQKTVVCEKSTDPTKSTGPLFRIFTPCVLRDSIDGIIRSIKRGSQTDLLRQNDDFYRDLESEFKSSLLTAGVVNPIVSYGEGFSKVFYDFTVDFNKKHPECAIMIPQDVINKYPPPQPQAV